MSLTVDLRLPGGAKSASVSNVGQKISLELWATVKGGNTSTTDDALQSAMGSLLSANVNGGAANGTLSFTPGLAWSALGSHNGDTKDLDGDGDLDVGSNDNSIDLDFVALRAGSLMKGASFKLGTATFTVTSLKSTTGQTNLIFRGRNALAGGVWLEDGAPKRPTTDGANFNDGTAVVLTRGGTTTGGSISGTVFNDADKDNVFDATEGGLGNVKVFIDADKDGVLDSGEKTSTTDSSGGYFFTGLAAGSYRVRQQSAPTNFKITSPSTGYHDVTLTTNQNVTKNFANQSTAVTPTGGSIRGIVFSDNDKDGVLDTTDTKLSGKKMYIDANKNGKLDTGEKSVTSNASGEYAFTGLAAGSYRIRRADLPSGYTFSTPSAGYYDITLTSNQQVTGKNFGAILGTISTGGGSISGTVFSDADKDGVLDATGDTKLASKKMYIDANKNGKFDTGEKSVTSNASGVFTFSGLAAGTYRIRRADLPTGYKYSTPSAGYYDIILGTNQTVTGKNFGAIPI